MRRVEQGQADVLEPALYHVAGVIHIDVIHMNPRA
jgi:hypothetical protein